MMQRVEREPPLQSRRAIAQRIGDVRMAELVEDQADQQGDAERDEEDDEGREAVLADEKTKYGTTSPLPRSISSIRACGASRAAAGEAARNRRLRRDGFSRHAGRPA